jgi:hypothetical protein
MQPHSTMNTYMVPITMGRQATTATLDVYQPVRITSRGDVAPLSVVSLQHDLDRLQEGPKLSLHDIQRLASRLFSAQQFLPIVAEAAATGAAGDEVDRVAVHTDRLMPMECAFREWQQIAHPAGPGVQLPPDLED